MVRLMAYSALCFVLLGYVLGATLASTPQPQAHGQAPPTGRSMPLRLQTGKISQSTVALPVGFVPTALCQGENDTLLVSSWSDGSVLQVDPQSSTSSIRAPGAPGRMLMGIVYYGTKAYAAGGDSGKAYVFDLSNNGPAHVREVNLVKTGQVTSRITDVVIVQNTAYFSDSLRPVLYRVRLPVPETGDVRVEELPITGEFHLALPLASFFGNTLESLPGVTDSLLIAQVENDGVYRVNLKTGAAQLLHINGGLTAGIDAIHMAGHDKLFGLDHLHSRILEFSLQLNSNSGSLIAEHSDPRLATGIATSVHLVDAETLAVVLTHPGRCMPHQPCEHEQHELIFVKKQTAAA